jgi:hypothetical protein
MCINEDHFLASRALGCTRRHMQLQYNRMLGVSSHSLMMKTGLRSEQSFPYEANERII